MATAWKPAPTRDPVVREADLRVTKPWHLWVNHQLRDYIDSNITAQDLDFTGDTGGDQAVDLDSEKLTIAGTVNQISTVSSAQTLTISTPQDIHSGASPTFNRLTTTVATGTAPFTVASTTLNTNLNADLLDGLHAADIVTVPAGSDTHVQYNDGGAPNVFGADAGFVTDKSGTVTVSTAYDTGAGGVYKVNTDTVLDVSGDRCLKVGIKAGFNATGGQCVWVGDNAGGEGTSTGAGNTVTGSEAGESLVGGSANTIYGQKCGQSLTSGSSNSLYGQGCAPKLTTGNLNCIFAQGGAANLVTASSLTIYGSGVADQLTAGAFLTLIGTSACAKATNVSRVTAVGASSLNKLVSNHDSSAVGFGAGNRSLGSRNNFFGSQAGVFQETGDDGCMTGCFSGYGLGAYTSSQNCYYGNYSGFTSGDGVNACNIYGFNAGYYNVTANRLIIDNQRRVDAATEVTNCIIHGDMAAANTSQALRINAHTGIRTDGETTFDIVSDLDNDSADTDVSLRYYVDGAAGAGVLKGTLKYDQGIDSMVLGYNDGSIYIASNDNVSIQSDDALSVDFISDVNNDGGDTDINLRFAINGIYGAGTSENVGIVKYDEGNRTFGLGYGTAEGLTFDYLWNDASITNDALTTTAIGRVLTAGHVWTPKAVTAHQWDAICHGDGKFVAVSLDGAVMTSQDGHTWADQTAASANSWTSVCYGMGLFVAVSYDGTNDRIMVSNNGEDWTPIDTTSVEREWRSVCYGNGLFVAVASSGTGDRVATSPDGYNWTLRVSAEDNPWKEVTYGASGGYVAVASSGTNRVMKSADGIIWAPVLVTTNSWLCVTYGNGVYAALSSGGTNRSMLSFDGSTWYPGSGGASNSRQGICYGNGIFVGVAYTGTGLRVLTSPDGSAYHARVSTEDNDWRDVAFGNGTFVAVSYDGTNRVAISGYPWSAADATDHIIQGEWTYRRDLLLESNLVLPKTSGNGIKIDTTTPTFGWRDITGTIRKRGVGATDPSDAVYRGGSVKQWQFAVNDECWIEYHIPHDYVPGTDIHLHFHWSHNSAIVTGGNVTWAANVTYAKGHNQAAFSAEVNPTVTDNASTTQYQHMIGELQLSASTPGATQIDTDNLEPDTLILVHIYLSANNITSSGAVPDPFLHEADIHYQSTNICTKNNSPDFYA